MATKEMTPQQANELLNALQMAGAACTRAMGQVDGHTDLYDQLQYTLKHLISTSDSVMNRFVPPMKHRAGRK